MTKRLPLYTEIVQKFSPATSTYLLIHYEQPRRQRIKYLAYERYTKLVWPIVKRIERPLMHRHESRCPGCGFGVSRDTGERVNICLYLPLGVRQDCRAFEMSGKGRGKTWETEIEETLARRLGWPA